MNCLDCLLLNVKLIYCENKGLLNLLKSLPVDAGNVHEQFYVDSSFFCEHVNLFNDQFNSKDVVDRGSQIELLIQCHRNKFLQSLRKPSKILHWNRLCSNSLLYLTISISFFVKRPFACAELIAHYSHWPYIDLEIELNRLFSFVDFKLFWSPVKWSTTKFSEHEGFSIWIKPSRYSEIPDLEQTVNG